MPPLEDKRIFSNPFPIIFDLLRHPKKIINLVYNCMFDHGYFTLVTCLLFFAEIIVNVVVIFKIPYTEIDWEAYMSEVEGFLNGTYDYMKLEGATGPLVYPAGFVYVFSAMYYVTNHGENIRLAQYLFAVLYLVTILLVFYLYYKSKKIPPYVLFFMCCASYRIHSIFILRLFNDPVAMFFLFISIICFTHDQWSVGCLFFSFGVSIKMNVLLFAPGLLILLLNRFGLVGTIKQLIICALPQIIFAIPFLMENPMGYIIQSFNLGRQFFFVWTVNWRFLPEWLFLSRKFHLLLLVLHMLFLLIFILTKWSAPNKGWKAIFSTSYDTKILSANEIIRVMFMSNFIGMCFARSLHYQFYVWYFHTIPFLLWSIKMPSVLRLLILGLIEMSWNTYPSTNFSSAMLHFCHFVILFGLLLREKIEDNNTVATKKKH